MAIDAPPRTDPPSPDRPPLEAGPGAPASERSASAGKGLAARALAGLLWMYSGTTVQVILRIAVMAILARLLTPEDYGLVGAALIVVSFAQLFSQLGVGPALVQRPVLEDRHLRTAFTVFTLAGLVVGGLIALGAPLVALFFERAELVPILRVAALAFPLQGLAAVPNALLTRELRFRWLAAIDVVTYLGGYGLVGVGLALLRWGAWALVGASLAQFLINVTMLLFARPFPKRPLLEPRAFRELMYYGGGFTIGSVLGYIASQGDNAVVGRWLGATLLGLYGRAYNLLVLPASYFSNVLDQVLFPSLALVQDDSEQLRAGYRYGMTAVALVVLPVSVAAIVLAPEFVVTLLGPAWSGVVLPFQILAVGMLFRTAARINSSITRAMGAVYRRAWREGVYAFCVVAGALIGKRWGVAGVAYGVLFALAVHFALMTQFSLTLVSMRVQALLAAHRPGLLLAAITLVEVWPLAALMRRFAMPPAAILVTPVVVAGCTLLLLAGTLPRLVLGPDGERVVVTLRSVVAGKIRRRQAVARARRSAA